MKNSTVIILLCVGIIVFLFLSRLFMFEKMMIKIIKHEGGYVNDPDDSGGETKYGISDNADGVVDGKFHGVPIKSLTLPQAYTIYKKFYYIPLGIDKIENKNLGMQLFDFGVNAGISRAKKVLTEAQKISQESGETLLDTFVYLRKQFYKNIATGKKEKYLAGWLKRVDDSYIV